MFLEIRALAPHPSVKMISHTLKFPFIFGECTFQQNRKICGTIREGKATPARLPKGGEFARDSVIGKPQAQERAQPV